MSYLSVKEVEVNSLNYKLKFSPYKFIELQEQTNSMEVLLQQIGTEKERAKRELEKMRLKVIGKPMMKGAKHFLWD
jgi:chromosome segregation ATPase